MDSVDSYISLFFGIIAAVGTIVMACSYVENKRKENSQNKETQNENREAADRCRPRIVPATDRGANSDSPYVCLEISLRNNTSKIFRDIELLFEDRSIRRAKLLGPEDYAIHWYVKFTELYPSSSIGKSGEMFHSMQDAREFIKVEKIEERISISCKIGNEEFSGMSAAPRK